ncbi:MAG: SdiA-regulated domain-containing protein [Chromatiaceae bacterium]|nr:SdiA-regulated domain-containing protein [Chromatiaceae bacterium]
MNSHKRIDFLAGQHRSPGEVRESAGIERSCIESVNEKVNRRFSGSSRKHHLLIYFWLLAVVALVVIASRYHASSRQFFGIAGSTEKTISFQYPVEIVNISVAEGSKVERGEFMLEVKRFDLAASLSIVEDEIAEIMARKNELIASTAAEIRRLEADKLAAQSELDVQLAKVETQLALNAHWKSDKPNLQTTEQLSPENLLAIKHRGLQQQKIHSATSFQATIDNLRQQLNSSERPADAKIEVLKKRKQELKRQAASLKVESDFSGSVGSVMFTAGEQVPKFSPILTLQGGSTSFVKAYIHEAVLNEVRVGQKVWIESLSPEIKKVVIPGRVESLGNRIVEYPERLKRSPLVSAWGREVMIELEENNELLLGEKVSVLLDQPESWIDVLPGLLRSKVLNNPIIESVQARNGSDGVRIHKIIATGLQAAAADSIEASGVVWDPVTNVYWMISDEDSYLYQLNAQGEIVQRLEINGLRIDDAESISIDGDCLYISASLSFNKAGVLKNRRRKLVRLQREKKGWVYQQEVDLYKALQTLTHSDSLDARTKSFITMATQEASIDIEAHQVRDNVLYLGFKSPLNSGSESVILRIDDLASLFSGLPVRAEIWRSFQLDDGDGSNTMTISDMIFFGDKIYLTGVDTYATNSSSGLWELSGDRQRAALMLSFPGYKAEGIAINRQTREAKIVFDGGGKGGSHFAQASIH